MPEDTFEDIRERLFQAAWDEPAYAPNRERVVRRARRRATTTIAGGVIAAVTAIAVGTAAFPGDVGERTAGPDGDDRLLEIDVRTGSARETTVFPADAHFFEVAPVGDSVVFVRQSDRPQLWVADRDGSNLRQVTRDPFGAGWPAWSPDGRRIAYLGYAGPGHPTLFIVDLRSGERRQLLPVRDVEPRAPAWSPDGTKIAFHVDREVPRGQVSMASTGPVAYRSHLRIVDVATGDVRRVTGNGTSDLDPGWLPDGRLVFMRLFAVGNHIDRSELWVADADGSHQRKLATTARGAWAWASRVSPGGTRVAFIVDEEGEPSIQAVLDLASGTVRRLGAAFGAVWLDEDTLLVEAPPATTD